MSYDVNLLKTRPECVTAKTSLEAKLDVYQNRDQNDAFQERQDDRAEASVSSQLTTASNQVDYLTDQLARPDLSDTDRKRYENELLTANYQKARLTNRAADTGGAPAFLGQVEDVRVDAQVTVLTGAITAVQARHDALPA